LKQTQHSYFLYRFGQPRHLVALSLMTLIESPRKPVLDFGCGFGHLTRHLPRRVGHQPIIGADYDFLRLYVAKNFVASDALYVCCNGDASLPFINEFFSVVYTSDTLVIVTNKAICSREIQRVADRDGLIIAAGLRNRLIEPQKNSTDIPYHTFGELFAPLPHRFLANADVLNRYVNKRGPALTRSSEKQTLDDEPWFSIVATKREELLVDRGPFADWPHAEGQLELNPLYKPVGDQGNGTGETLYRHTFPSSWYEHEDGDCRKYEPESVSISSQILKDLSSRKRTADMEDLIAHCVIVGIPDRFHRDPGSISLADVCAA
jgi:ubiquinone/menaquinone biosynthesis C-methylase UbiE